MLTSTTIVPQSNVCLIVTASQSLHLRQQPTEHSLALDWLEKGLIIEGLLQEGTWWLVDTGTKQGYVKSDFVESCQQNDP